MQKISSVILYILAAISVVLAGLFFFGPVITEFGEEVPKFYTHNLGWAAILFIAAVAITLIFSVVYLITHPKALKGAIISIFAMGVLVVLAYFLASDLPMEGMEGITPKTLKWTGTGLILTYILIIVAVVGILASEIYRAFK